MLMLTGIVILGIAPGLQAQQPPSPQQAQGQSSRGPQRNPEAIKTILDLSERQYAELMDLRTAHQAKLEEYRTESRELEQQKRAIMQASGADPVKIGSITLRQEAIQQMIKDENDAYHKGSLSLLTATQRDKVTAIEEALKLAPNAGTLMQFGLLDSSAMGGRGFMGMAQGQGMPGQRVAPMMMRGGGPPPQN